jgi:hypothetical protein
MPVTTTLYQMTTPTSLFSNGLEPKEGAESMFAFVLRGNRPELERRDSFEALARAGIGAVFVNSLPRRIDNFLIFLAMSRYGLPYGMYAQPQHLPLVRTITFCPTRFCRSADGGFMAVATVTHQHVLDVAADRGPAVRLADSPKVHRIARLYRDPPAEE